MVPPGVVTRAKSLLARSRPKPRKSLRDIVVCPSCKGTVMWADDEIRCSHCAARYPILRGIPRLLPRERT
jgi:uncharacterized protein YbaR (Trm112 family)